MQLRLKIDPSCRGEWKSDPTRSIIGSGACLTVMAIAQLLLEYAVRILSHTCAIGEVCGYSTVCYWLNEEEKYGLGERKRQVLYQRLERLVRFK
jgi:hypothetical protein